jgi:hypothetical protein
MQVARLRLVDSATDETCHIIASMVGPETLYLPEQKPCGPRLGPPAAFTQLKKA